MTPRPVLRTARASRTARLLAACFLRAGMQVMGEQIDPQVYSRLFMNNRPAFDHIAAAVLTDLPNEPSSNSATVLDLAAGPGEPSLTLAKLDMATKAFKVKQIVTTDMQPGMLEKAKGRVAAAGVSEEKFVFDTTSADDLSKYADNHFDAVMMSFGLMFVPDKQKCLQEIARVLRPGGRAYLSVWKELPFYTFARSALEEAAGKTDLPQFGIDPSALAAEGAVENVAEGANLEVVKSDKMAYTFAMGSAKETSDGLKILAGSILEQLESDGQAGVGEKFDAIVEREVQARGWIKEGEVGIPGNAPQILTLQKPEAREEL